MSQVLQVFPIKYRKRDQAPFYVTARGEATCKMGPGPNFMSIISSDKNYGEATFFILITYF
jgi:hypothetical protein